jgi:hypothetical protein
MEADFNRNGLPCPARGDSGLAEIWVIVWPIAHVPQPVRELLEILFQIHSVLLLGDAINPHCPVRRQCFEAGTQMIHLADMMIETGEDQL